MKLTLIVLFFIVSFSVTATNVKLLVKVPESTPKGEILSLGGDFNGWDPSNRSFLLTQTDKGQYVYDFKGLTPGTVLNFKITRGNWDTVEIAADGSNRDNRAYLVGDEDFTITAEVALWSDLSTKIAPSTVVGNVVEELVEISTFGKQRKIRVYLPPDYQTSNKKYPVIYMTDGQNLFDRRTANAGEWEMDELMENLTEDNSSLASIVVGIDHAGKNRRQEYMPFPYSNNKGKGKEFAHWLVYSLKPYIDNKYRTKPERQFTSMAGSSMGGLISCYTVLEYQEVFSKAACLSSAFLKRLVTNHWINYIESTSKHLNTKIYIDMGDNEFGLFGDDILLETKEVYDSLLKAGFSSTELRFQIIKGGTHDEPSWRKRMLGILQWLQ